MTGKRVSVNFEQEEGIISNTLSSQDGSLLVKQYRFKGKVASYGFYQNGHRVADIYSRFSNLNHNQQDWLSLDLTKINNASACYFGEEFDETLSSRGLSIDPLRTIRIGTLYGDEIVPGKYICISSNGGFEVGTCYLENKV